MRPEFHDALNFVPESVERAPVVGASSSRVSLLLCIAFPAAITVTTDCVAHHATIIELSTERYRRRGALGNRARDHAGPPAEIENHDVNEEPLPWAAEQATAQLPVPVTTSSNTSPFWISAKKSTLHRTHLYRAQDRMRDLVRLRQSALHPALNTKRPANAA